MFRREVLSGVAVAIGVCTAGCVGGAGGRDGRRTADPSATPTAAATDPGTGLSAVTLAPQAACPEPGEATVRLDADPVTVVGCVVGKNGCTRPRLSAVEREDATVTVVVAAVEEREEGEACTEGLSNLGYEVRVADEDPPTGVTVVHDDVYGRRVVADVTR